MNNLKKSVGGRKKVVFDSRILATYPTGVVIDNVDAKARFTDGIIPAGTVVVKDGNKYKILNVALTAALLTNAIGLVADDIPIEDMTQSPVAIDATVRIEALPDLEKTGVNFLIKALPSLKFVKYG